MRFAVKITTDFLNWRDALLDRKVRIAVNRRLERMAEGNFGDSKHLGRGLSEARIHLGPGYRIYYAMQSGQIVVLLTGGNKAGQDRDIAKARQLLEGL